MEKDRKNAVTVQGWYKIYKKACRGKGKIPEKYMREITGDNEIKEIDYEELSDSARYYIKEEMAENEFQIFRTNQYEAHSWRKNSGLRVYLVLDCNNKRRESSNMGYIDFCVCKEDEPENVRFYYQNVNAYVALTKILRKCSENYWAKIPHDEQLILLDKKKMLKISNRPSTVVDNFKDTTLDLLDKILTDTGETPKEPESYAQMMGKRCPKMKDKANIPKRTKQLMAKALQELSPLEVFGHIEFDEEITEKQVAQLVKLTRDVVLKLGKPALKNKLTLRFRKLGRGSASGKFYSGEYTILVDANVLKMKGWATEYITIFAHEYTHCLDYFTYYISAKPSGAFGEYYTAYLQIEKSLRKAINYPNGSRPYYISAVEVLARLMEYKTAVKLGVNPKYYRNRPGYKIIARTFPDEELNQNIAKILTPLEDKVSSIFI